MPRRDFGRYVGFIHALGKQISGRAALSASYALIDSDPQLAQVTNDRKAEQCYIRDRQLVLSASAVVADVTFPSIGVGIELEIASSAGIPVILAYRTGSKNRAAQVFYRNPDSSVHELQIGEGYVSLMALGLPTVKLVVEYRDYSEGVVRIVDACESLVVRGASVTAR